MQPSPSAPSAAQPQPPARVRPRFFVPVLAGAALILVEMLVFGLISLFVSFSIADGGISDPGLYQFLSYLSPVAVLLGGIGAFLVLYGLAMGLRVLLGHRVSAATRSEVPGSGMRGPPVASGFWWMQSPYGFVVVGAILVLLGSLAQLTMMSLSLLQIYPSPTTTAFGDVVRVTTTVNFVAGLLGTVGTILAYIGIAVALSRATS